MIIRKYLDNLQSKGRHSFTAQELKKALGLSGDAIRSSLSRLQKKREVAFLAKGYYIIVPLEYRALKSLPPDHFIDGLMKHLQIPYYVSLLSAAQRYGAAHQKPQIFQVMVPISKRPIKVGRVRVEFIMKKLLKETPTQRFNTPRGYIFYSTPEATAVDLVSYPSRSGGLGNVITVLAELVEEMKIDSFKEALAFCSERSILQRLGYLFELNEEGLFAEAVFEHLRGRGDLETVLLDIRSRIKKGEINKKWRLIINTQLESEV
jgi:predicted transcriptional regulator of viral defense system